MKTSFEYMNGEMVEVNKNGTSVQNLYFNGLCLNCEGELTLDEVNRDVSFCSICEVTDYEE